MPTTELAEARRAFGFFETIHACITAGAQPRKRHRKETSAIPEPMQDPRRNWRKFDERLDFSRLLTPASPQRHSREKDTVRRLLPCRSLCKTHDRTGGSSTSVWIFRDCSRLHHRRGTAEKKTPQVDFCHAGAHAKLTTELAEARRAFGFFETAHACITAGAQPRKRHRKETSAIPEPMQDPRRQD